MDFAHRILESSCIFAKPSCALGPSRAEAGRFKPPKSEILGLQNTIMVASMPLVEHRANVRIGALETRSVLHRLGNRERLDHVYRPQRIPTYPAGQRPIR